MAFTRLAIERALRHELPDLRLGPNDEALIARAPWVACIGIQLDTDDAIAEQDRLEIKDRLQGRLPYVQVWGAKLVIGFAVRGAGDDDRAMVEDFAQRVSERLGRGAQGVTVSRIEYSNAADRFPRI